MTTSPIDEAFSKGCRAGYGFLEKRQWLNVSSILRVVKLQPLRLKLSVVIVATDNEQRALLQAAVDDTKVARSVDALPSLR